MLCLFVSRQRGIVFRGTKKSGDMKAEAEAEENRQRAEKKKEGRKGLLIAVLHDKITGLFIYGAIGVGVFFSLTA